MIHTMWAQASDGVLAGARTAGDGEDAIVFVHGVGSTAAIWDRQLRHFGDAYRTFAIELRGNGVARPEPMPELITRNGFVKDVLAIVDAARVRRFHFVGCSLGGVVGFELWKRFPERVRSFAFVGSFAAYPDARQYAAGVRDAVLASGDMTAFARERASKLGLPPHRTAETVAQMACKSVESYLASTEATWTGDYRPILKDISVPSLVLVGEHDRVAPPALSREIVAGIPGARLEVLHGAGHVSNADEPQAFDAALRSFYDEIRSGKL
ncbi:MAG TPA: alpha/beta fold hydrolase [Candidatus Baltobacteraceae bacterium]|jgi:pimeloyl-ACP methyl ester carboxylesterase